MSDFVEKRQFARTEVNAALKYQIAGAEVLQDGLLGNISAGGILLWTEQELRVGTMLYLHITSDELVETELEVTATVVRIDPVRQSRRFGYGCRFEALYGGPLPNESC